MPAAEVEGGNINFQNWKETVQLQIEASKAQAENMVKYAQAEKTAAEARQEHARANAMIEVLRQLHSAYVQLAATKGKLNAKIEWIEQQRQNLRFIHTGAFSSPATATNLWSSFRVLLPFLPPAKKAEFRKTKVLAEWRSGDNFVRVSSPGTTCEDVPKDKADLFALLIWLSEKHVYMPKLDRLVADTIAESVQVIPDYAIPERDALNAEIKSRTDAVYDIWDPITFFGLEKPKPPTK